LAEAESQKQELVQVQPLAFGLGLGLVQSHEELVLVPRREPLILPPSLLPRQLSLLQVAVQVLVLLLQPLQNLSELALELCPWVQVRVPLPA